MVFLFGKRDKKIHSNEIIIEKR